jgi:hypothetical protein
MSEDDFLKRWSRRKREVAKAEANPAPTQPKDQVPAKAAEPEFDVSTLPPIDSITAVSDITAFLRAGVPPDLTRAALRRVWTADPAIRDFVGLAENAWDFTDPNAMPGFGPLEATDEVRRMIADVVRQIGEAAQPGAPEAAQQRAEVVENSNDSNVTQSVNVVDTDSQPVLATDQPQENPAQDLGSQVVAQGKIDIVATQHDPAVAQGIPKQITRRGHGGALPQ